MEKGYLTLAISGVIALLYVIKDGVAIIEALKKVAGYIVKGAAFANSSIILARSYISTLFTKSLNTLRGIFTGEKLIVPDDDPTPPKPGGGKPRTGPIAFVGYRAESPGPLIARARPVGTVLAPGVAACFA